MAANPRTAGVLRRRGETQAGAANRGSPRAAQTRQPRLRRQAAAHPLQGGEVGQTALAASRAVADEPFETRQRPDRRDVGYLIGDEPLSWDIRLFHPADETLLKSLPLKTLNDGPYPSGMPADDFWKQITARRKAAEEFVESAAKLLAEKQVEAVRARLAELAGKLAPNSIATLGTKTAGEMVTEATLILSNHPHDLTPLMTLGGLKKLTITGGADWLDLSPVSTLPLEELTCPEPMARKNAPVLAEIKTLKTINGQPASEFWKQNASAGSR